jgi:hypothetical protein
VVVAVLGMLPWTPARAGDSAEDAKRAAEVRKKLAAPVEFSGIEDAELPLQEALKFVSDRFAVAFEVNEQAFRDEQIDNINEKAVGRSMPKMTNVPLETVLRRILARVQAVSGTTFVVRGGVVEITTRRAASPSTWEQAPEVSASFDKRELQAALKEIADATGVNVVLDGRATDKGKTVITATLRDVGVDTAVQLLANMADLTTMTVENVLYVTTKENAKALRAELLKLEPAKAESKSAKAEPKSAKAESAPLKAETERLLKEHEEQIRRLKAQFDRTQPDPAAKKDQ